MQGPTETVNDSMARAHRLAQSGDLAAAAALCRNVLTQSPRQFYALFMLGSIEAQQGRPGKAEALLADAIAVNPQSAETLTVYGDVLSTLNRHADAIDSLTRALKLQARNPNALIYRGIALAKLERHAEAYKDFTQALQFDPQSLFALHNRVNVLIALDRPKEAEADINRLLALAPDFTPGIANRVNLLLAQKKHAIALPEIGRALRLEPHNATLWKLAADIFSALSRHDEALAASAKALAMSEDAETLLTRGNVLMAAGRHTEALEAYDKAAALDPNSAEAHFNRTNALMELERLDEALLAVDKAIGLRPNFAAAHLLRGNILLHLRRETESLACHDAAIAAKPGYAEAHYHRGSLWLLTGRMEEGWRDFEFRWQAEDCTFERPALVAPVWRGEPLSGRSIIVYSEQGLGDTLQFVRFIPMLTAMGARVTFLCHPNLLRLFQPYAATMELIPSCDPRRPFDFQSALMSLPLHLGIGLTNLAADVPYVSAEPDRVAHWRERIGEKGFRIGIGWQGNPAGKIDRGRSVPLAQFAPLAAIPGVRLVSVQKRHGLDQLTALPPGMKVETLDAFDEGDDAFVDTAAIMESLDLIVSSDTATAHLAGALARPVWVALAHVPDWRWMLDRSNSPWYPTMQLFRQRIRGRWEEPFAEMAAALRERTKGKA